MNRKYEIKIKSRNLNVVKVVEIVSNSFGEAAAYAERWANRESREQKLVNAFRVISVVEVM